MEQHGGCNYWPKDDRVERFSVGLRYPAFVKARLLITANLIGSIQRQSSLEEYIKSHCL